MTDGRVDSRIFRVGGQNGILFLFSSYLAKEQSEMSCWGTERVACIQISRAR